MLSRILAALALLGACVVPAQAQNYPTKPVTMIIPFAAGGPTDTLGRNLAVAWGRQLKQTIIVENLGSAGGIVAVARVAKATPDGYTLLLHHIGMSTSPSLYRKLDFNPLTDFEYVGLVAEVPMTLVARHDFPAKDFKEFLAYVKSNSQKVTLANAGVGAASHLCGLLFMSAIQTDFLTVPYKGTAPAMNDLLGGQVDFMCDQTTNTTSQIKAGKVKVFGVTTRQRIASLKDVPTLDEQGLKGFEVGVWHGVYAPKNTPKPVMDALVNSMQAALKDPTLINTLAQLGTEPMPQKMQTPQALQAHLKSEIDKWSPIIKKAGVYAD
jgi:tripartite-type tricarboxylate transporter receptor subunit TctC